jgi:hypothetical protein
MKKKVAVGLLFFVFVLTFLSWGGVRIYKGIEMRFQFTSYLKRAANANTVELAKPQLDMAVEYLEDHNLMSGVVSIFFNNPTNDVGYFYQNLKACQNELEQVDPNASQLEKSNLLMKLRETLVDGDKIIKPNGLSIYPNNKLFFWWAIISLIGMIIFGSWWWSSIDE